MTNCGAGGIGTESCCTSLEVPGGTYERTFINNGSGPSGEADPATLSGFRLDKYLVTVGRFRQFVGVAMAADGGAAWVPPPGSGKHTHVHGGQGLINSDVSPDAGIAYETGWRASDNGNIALTSANLACSATFATWTSTAGSEENLPINCMSWYQAYAFCIWDGGFLPSEAEWEYAAAGGTQLRDYPWGSTDPGMASRYAIYSCYYPSAGAGCTGVANIARVGTASQGAARWGQLDMAGELWEWGLDFSSGSYLNPCVDCAYLTLGNGPGILRGGDFGHYTGFGSSLRASHRTDSLGGFHAGFRCARTP